METKKITLQEISPADYNPRKINEEEYNKLNNSMAEFGLVDPIIINLKNNRIIGGHQRYEVLIKQNPIQELSLIQLGDIGWVFQNENISIPSEEHEKALNLALNKISGEWDEPKLKPLLEDLSLKGFDIELTGFDNLDIEKLKNVKPVSSLIRDNLKEQEGTHPLSDDFIVPPFSVLYKRGGEWQKRKQYWENFIKDNGESRTNTIGEGYGVSIFDPVLAEIINLWFTPLNQQSNIIDPFAGDSVFGYVATALNNKFTGIELREEQCKINNQRLNDFPESTSHYINDDGQNILKHIKKETQDLLFSCPPYYDLEVYSDLKEDASNQETYGDFLKIIKTAFTNSIKTLKDNSFATIVCGDIRDEKGFYYGFPEDIKKIFKENNLNLYNELILVEPIGTAPVRARRYMRNRKVIKTHQNVLVFYKGDPQKIQEKMGVIEG